MTDMTDKPMEERMDTSTTRTLPGQERFVAPVDETPLSDVDSIDESAPATNMWASAWKVLLKGWPSRQFSTA